MTSAAPARSLPREVLVEKMRDGICFRLPARQLGPVHLAGLVPLAFGLLIMSVPLILFREPLRGVFTKPNLFHGFIGVFLLVWCIGAMKPVKFGALLLWGRCRVELTRDWLRAIDSAGPFRSVRKTRREDIRRFEVAVGQDKPYPRFLNALKNIGGLEAKFDGDARPMLVALGYPHDWLVALGDELTRNLNESNVVASRSSLPPTTEVVRQLSSEHDAAPMPAEEMPVQPKNSRARIEETRDSVTLTLPPAGFVGATRASFVFAIVWCAFMAIVTGIPLATGKLRHAWPILLFGSLFWFIGIAMILGAINMARRRALLIATANDLRIAQQTFFGNKTWSWSRAEIGAVRVDASGTRINNRPVFELQIHPRGGRKVGLFGGRDETELQWIATMLRKKLQVAAA